jgi:hypothetical protein
MGGLRAAVLVFGNLLASPGFPAYEASLERINAFSHRPPRGGDRHERLPSLSAAASLVFVVHLHELLRRGGMGETRVATWPLAEVAAAALLLLSALLF